MRDAITIRIPIHAFKDKLSFINKSPVNAANRGDKASIDNVLRVPISFKDLR